MGEEWGCPNWKPNRLDVSNIDLMEHRLQALHASIEPPKNKKMLAVIKGYENFLKVPSEEKGNCYKTCPHFYQTKGSPIASDLEQITRRQRFFTTGQYSLINPDATNFDIEAQEALMLGESLVENYYNQKTRKENEEIRKQMEADKKKRK